MTNKKTKWNINSAKEKSLTLGVELLSDEYSYKKLHFKCGCGNEFYRPFSNVLLGQNTCLECSQKRLDDLNKKRRIDSFNELIQYIKNNLNGFELLSQFEDYKNNKTKLTMKCKCGNIFHPTALNIKSGKSTKCMVCSMKDRGKNKRKPIEDIKLFVEKENYKFIKREIRDTQSWIMVQCPNSKHKSYWVSWRNFISGNRCPICNLSKGEEKVKHFLDKYNLNYKREFSIKGLKGINNRLLRFDFCVTINNEITLIEYDGEQHYKPKFGEYEFNRTVQNDKLKDEYCNKNNINLIRISYLEFDNIENILLNKLINQANTEITNII